jgi:hypothetical protein
VEGRRGQAGSSSGTSWILGWRARESSRREERLEAEDVALEERPRPFGGCEEPGRGLAIGDNGMGERTNFFVRRPGRLVVHCGTLPESELGSLQRQGG